MPGDPKECQKNALRCAELARTAKTEQLKSTLLNLSQNWVKLAESLEAARTLLDEDKQRVETQLSQGGGGPSPGA